MYATACGDRQRVDRAAVRLAPQLEHVAQARPADVLHDDVAGALVLDEVEDLDDVRVLDLREEAALRERRRHRVVVVAVEQSLQDDPAVGDVVVARQVDPAEAAVGEASDDLVLAGDEFPRRQLRDEGERRPAAAAEAFRPPLGAVATAADRLVATRAEPALLRDGGHGHHGRRGVARRSSRDLDQPGSETPPRRRPPFVVRRRLLVAATVMLAGPAVGSVRRGASPHTSQ